MVRHDGLAVLGGECHEDAVAPSFQDVDDLFNLQRAEAAAGVVLVKVSDVRPVDDAREAPGVVPDEAVELLELVSVSF